ncbi:biotin--[acetyl-CoA-carboxylase] ligase [Sulfitobacter sp. D35]|uniref:biotin--[acetyl-CoA-carboxylase] ligase n=1 Tax=Sulfitobacter sp. D35 TaxID=3083252 RepID=UPI00296E9A4E|nr:biotin--[acetyl-CoA-carboxylase] ligase [Sulfitobacter sp. D35]MDW4496876.1 biotin--[acetyl-CoA-carboxylase] ligase [Sulfitobacter sp. D35]
MTDWPEGYGRRVLPKVDSTLSEATRIAPTLAGSEWILAKTQTAARGRRGRPWAMPHGNFAATLVLRPEGGPGQAALRSFVMSLALFEAFVAATGREAAFTLKWPNDVLLNGGKVAGILLESAGTSRGVQHLAIGVGVNLAAAPAPDEVEPQALRPVSLRGETGARVDPEAFLDMLAPAYARLEDQFRSQGFAPIRRAWLARAARLGETITARTGTAETVGRFEDVDGDGNLILQTPQGPRAIAAADVYF